jgi:hypothetical protein
MDRHRVQAHYIMEDSCRKSCFRMRKSFWLESVGRTTEVDPIIMGRDFRSLKHQVPIQGNLIPAGQGSFVQMAVET